MNTASPHRLCACVTRCHAPAHPACGGDMGKPGTAVLVHIKLKLELPLKFTVKDGVVLGGAQ